MSNPVSLLLTAVLLTMTGQCVYAQSIVVGPGIPFVPASEPTTTQYGFCGDRSVNDGRNVRYVYEPSTHTLTISGTGAMMDRYVPCGTSRIDGGYIQYITTVVIEEGVTTVGIEVFDMGHNITSVTLPHTITHIGDRAFYNCNQLQSITIPVGVKTIGEDAFSGCSALTSITIPESVKRIDSGAFSYCNSLTGISVEQGNKSFMTMSNSLLTIDGKTLLTYPGGLTATEYTIPTCVTAIGPGAFAGNINLTSVIIPQNVTDIDEKAFYDCENLETVSCTDNLSSIGAYAFQYTKWIDDQPDGIVYLGKVAYKFKGDGTPVIADGTVSITPYAFGFCPSLISITVPNSVKRIGFGAFAYCENLESIVLPDSITAIEDETFQSCKALASITIPDSVESVGMYAFYYCTSLTTITVPGNVKVIDDFAFEGCSNLETVMFDGESQLARIGDYAFDDCSSLSSITLPDGVESIGNNAFYGCSDLETINIPDNVEHIGFQAFKDCSNLKTITFPNYIEDIGGYAFHSTEWLDDQPDGKMVYIGRVAYQFKDKNNTVTSVDIEDGTRVIAPSAFDCCTSITAISIPSSVYAIGSNAFYGCSSLDDITLPDGIARIEDYTFFNCTSLDSIRIPSGVISIGISAFANCSSLTSITIPSSVKTIYEYAFNGAENIAHVYCYANPKDLSWEDPGQTGFCRDDESPIYPTKCHVLNCYLATYESKWSTGSTGVSGTDVNVEFAGDLDNSAMSTYWNADANHDGTTPERAYIITTPDGMDLLAMYVNQGNDFANTYFELGDDIVYHYEGLEETESNYTHIGYYDMKDMLDDTDDEIVQFNGTFDGKEHAIIDVKMYKCGYTGPNNCPNIFGVIGPDGTVKNLSVLGLNITGNTAIAGVAGLNMGSIDSCYVLFAEFNINAEHDSYSDGIGGIAGGNMGNITNCFATVRITVGDNLTDCTQLGGITGANFYGTINNCQAQLEVEVGDNVSGFEACGGIAGINWEGSITRCDAAFGLRLGDNDKYPGIFGGIAGSNEKGTLTDNVVFGMLIPDCTNCGAIAGEDDNGTLSNNYYTDCHIGSETSNIGVDGADIALNDGAVEATIIYEDDAIPSSLSGKIILGRMFHKNVSSTICLPFAIDADQAAQAGKFYTFAGITEQNGELTVIMTEEEPGNKVNGELSADTPYLFVPAVDGVIVFHGTVDGSGFIPGFAEHNNWFFEGTYENLEWNEGDHALGRIYGFAALHYDAPDNDGDGDSDYTINPGQFVKAGAGASISSYRAYMRHGNALAAPMRGASTDTGSLPAALKVMLVSGNGTITAVGTMDASTGSISIDSWYDMNGRPLQTEPTQSGMYIHNGRTIMINE